MHHCAYLAVKQLSFSETMLRFYQTTRHYILEYPAICQTVRHILIHPLCVIDSGTVAGLLSMQGLTQAVRNSEHIPRHRLAVFLQTSDRSRSKLFDYSNLSFHIPSYKKSKQ
jgi:hypothetical protein